MDTIKAIDFLENLHFNRENLSAVEFLEEIKKIVILLKEDGKYRQIVREINNERLFNEYDSVYTIPSNIYKDIHKTIKEIIQKHFPSTTISV